MTLDELKTKLAEMVPGNYAAIHYDLYADFFPPGEPDQRAREACHAFAEAHGCRIENKPELEEVWFVKDA
jgi:hypothetical protein